MTKLDWSIVLLISSGWIIAGLLIGCMIDNPLVRL